MAITFKEYCKPLQNAYKEALKKFWMEVFTEVLKNKNNETNN